MKNSTMLFVSMLLASCMPTISTKSPVSVHETNTPQLNVVASKELGDTMTELSYEVEKEAIILTNAPEAKYSGQAIQLKAGQLLPYRLTLNGNSIYMSDKTGQREGVAINQKTGKAVYYTDQGYLHLTGKKDAIAYTKTTYVDKDNCSGCFKKEFI
ncbi:MAG: hypothetical protein EOP49_23530 [Sphingobacteriales bacterium]|nr:MAG: hypothetical protein EOP49_23530 [Sphingobacteriales bacterium]